MVETLSDQNKIVCEETTLREVYDRLLEGTFYDDHDWASGPALRAVRLAVESSDRKKVEDLVIAARKVCYEEEDVSTLDEPLEKFSYVVKWDEEP